MLKQLGHILAQNVILDIHSIARFSTAERGDLQSVRNEGHRKSTGLNENECQTDAVDRNGTFRDHQPSDGCVGPKIHVHPFVIAFDPIDHRGPVNVSLNKMPPKSRSHRE